MSRLALKVLPWVAVLAIAGCGTIGNLQDRDKIYGGARLDGKEAIRASKELIHPADPPDYTTTQDTAILVYACVDMPLSLIADTLTLPITIPKTVYHWLKDGAKPPDALAAPGGGQVVAKPLLISAKPVVN